MINNTPSESTEVWSGVDNIISRSLEVMSKIRATYDLCLDIIGPSVILETEPIKNAYFELKNRGVKIRMITEVTKDNLHYCKELTQVVSEVRHLDGVKGNFAITDTEYMSYAISKEVRPSSFRQIVRSTSKEFVNQQQQQAKKCYWQNELCSLGIEPKRKRELNDKEELHDLSHNIKQAMCQDYKVA